MKASDFCLLLSGVYMSPQLSAGTGIFLELIWLAVAAFLVFNRE